MNAIIGVILWFTYLVSLYFVIFWLLVFIERKPKERKKRLEKFPFVSIVIPAYNEEKRIKATIKSILKLDYPRNKLEFIVVNDGSTDNTKNIVKKLIKENKGFNLKLINQENKGKGAALNAGIKIAKGEFFVCLDADSFVEKNALYRILPHFKGKKVAAVLPVLKVKKPKNLLQKMQWFEYLVNMFYKDLMSRLNCIHVAPGPFSVYRKKIIEKIGYFDENHNLTEDLEIALRLQHHHYRIIQLSKVDVWTISPKSIKGLYKQRNRWYKGSIINALKYRHMFFNKKYGDFGLIQMPTIIVAGIIALTMITSIAYYSLKPYIKALYNMHFVSFDFITYLTNYVFDFHLLDINYTLFLVAIVMLMFSVFVLKKSHNYTKERVTRFGMVPLFIYLLAYFLLLGIMWVGITIDLVTGKKQRW